MDHVTSYFHACVTPVMNSNVRAETIQSNQEDTFFMIVRGLMGTGTQEEIHSAISSCS